MASEKEIIAAIESAADEPTKIRIIDQLGLRVKPRHRELIRYLLEYSRKENTKNLSYSLKRALFQIRSRYKITNFPLFLSDPLSLLVNQDPGYRLKAAEALEATGISEIQALALIGRIQTEKDSFVLSRLLRLLPGLQGMLDVFLLKSLLDSFSKHSDSRVRANALESLAEMEKLTKNLSLQELQKSLCDIDQRVRESAINLVCQKESAEILQWAQEVLNSSSDFRLLESVILIISRLKLPVDPKIQKAATERFHKISSPLPAKSKGVRGLLFGLFFLVLFLTGVFFGRFFGSARVIVKEIPVEMPKVEKELPTPPKQPKEEELTEENVLKEGEILHKRANLLMEKADAYYLKEAYAKSMSLYKTVYEVYKDNRLAVESVRRLSKTQKVENTLSSVEDYIRKAQFISAARRLQEIRHLLEDATFENHSKRIEAEKIRRQEGK